MLLSIGVCACSNLTLIFRRSEIVAVLQNIHLTRRSAANAGWLSDGSDTAGYHEPLPPALPVERRRLRKGLHSVAHAVVRGLDYTIASFHCAANASACILSVEVSIAQSSSPVWPDSERQGTLANGCWSTSFPVVEYYGRTFARLTTRSTILKQKFRYVY